MLDVLQRIALAGDDQLQVFPDVVAEQFRRVVANARRRILSQDAVDCDGVIGVDPERQLRVPARLRLRVHSGQAVEVGGESLPIGAGRVPGLVVHIAVLIDVLSEQTVPGRVVNVSHRDAAPDILSDPDRVSRLSNIGTGSHQHSDGNRRDTGECKSQLHDHSLVHRFHGFVPADSDESVLIPRSALHCRKDGRWTAVLTHIPEISGCADTVRSAHKKPPKGRTVQGQAQIILSGAAVRMHGSGVHVVSDHISSLKNAKSLPAAPSPWHLMQPPGRPASGIEPFSGGATATVPFGLYLTQYQSPPCGL